MKRQVVYLKVFLEVLRLKIIKPVWKFCEEEVDFRGRVTAMLVPRRVGGGLAF